MPTFVYMTRCDGCGHCVDICPSDIMHIDTTYRRALNIEPNMCGECYSCVEAGAQVEIDCRGYAECARRGARAKSVCWGSGPDVACAEKGNPDWSGRVAQGLYQLDCYMGMHWKENQPEDHVRYARNALTGLVREDLGYALARQVASTVHKS